MENIVNIGDSDFMPLIGGNDAPSNVVVIDDLSAKPEDEKISVQFNTSKPRLCDLLNSLIDPNITIAQNDLLIRALRNKNILINYLNLSQRLLEKEITEEDFDNIVSDNVDEYFIKIDKKVSLVELCAMSIILEKIGGEFSVSDVEQMFSLDLSDSVNEIENSKLF